MSGPESIEVVEALYRAFEVGDHDGIRRCLAEDVRWQQAGSAVPAAGDPTRGREQLMDRVIVPIERDWDGFSEAVEDLFGTGERVVATGTYRGRHRASGRVLEAEFCHLWKVRGGRIRDFRQFTDTAAFAEATDTEVDDTTT